MSPDDKATDKQIGFLRPLILSVWDQENEDDDNPLPPRIGPSGRPIGYMPHGRRALRRLERDGLINDTGTIDETELAKLTKEEAGHWISFITGESLA